MFERALPDKHAVADADRRHVKDAERERLARSSSAATLRVCVARNRAVGWISHAAAAISTLSLSLSELPPA